MRGGPKAGGAYAGSVGLRARSPLASTAFPPALGRLTGGPVPWPGFGEHMGRSVGGPRAPAGMLRACSLRGEPCEQLRGGIQPRRCLTAAPLLSSSHRVKSEAITAHREPKEEVEDVSSCLCTELVYSAINVQGVVGRGGGAGRDGAVSGMPYFRSLGPLHISCVKPAPSSSTPTLDSMRSEPAPLPVGCHLAQVLAAVDCPQSWAGSPRSPAQRPGCPYTEGGPGPLT